jgi:poly-gamma-glutamate synthesis protein (capsule biosynthesis protein)
MTETIKLNAVGDVMLGDFPLTLGFGVGSSIGKNDHVGLFDGITHVLKNCDICFGNLEVVLSNIGLKKKDIISSQMRGDPCFVEILKDAGFNVMSVANNHILQHGSGAFYDTIERLVQNGILPIGVADLNEKIKPQFIKKNGMNIGFLAYSFRPEKYWPEVLYAKSDINSIINDIQMTKSNCDVVVVSIHWGDEFVQYPSLEQIKIGRLFIDAGASLILGHHPHILQGLEYYKCGLIAYSLGNFVFDFWQNKFRKTFILHCELSKKGIENYNYTPVYIKSNYAPEIMDGKGNAELLQMVHTLSKKIQNITIESNFQEKIYKANVRKKLFINKVENRLFFLKNFFRYEPWVLRQSICRFIGERLIK